MDRELDEEIKISLLKRLTGRQDPSLKRIIASVIVAVLIFLSTGCNITKNQTEFLQ